jgi:hypothetical protein
VRAFGELTRTDVDGAGDGYSETFAIAPHVHVCVTLDGSVLLDLKRDKYLGLGKEETELVGARVGVWPRPRWDSRLVPRKWSASAPRAQELCRSLAEQGLLVAVTEELARAPEPAFGDMRREWISIGDEIDLESAVTRRHVANMVAAFSWARCSLAWRPLRATVESIRAKKAAGRDRAECVPMLEVAGLVGAFRRMRPFLFAAEGRCLLHALTLTRFLSRYDFYPEWVIGVATQPWAAHSWVQWGDCLLDTNPEKICRYTPILVV